MKKNLVIKLLIIPILLIGMTYSQTTDKFIDELNEIVEKVQETFKVPGISITIVKDDKVLLSEGYGTTQVKNGSDVDSKTVFGIASNTKAFTAAGLAILIDEGKLKWTDKVKDILPEFEMYDPFVTNEFMVKDLLTHQSGLSGGYGDLMLWPSSDFKRSEIVKKIKFFKPKHSFRTKFGYSNILYIVAGEVIQKITGQSWEDFTRERIVKKLEMDNTYMGVSELTTV